MVAKISHLKPRMRCFLMEQILCNWLVSELNDSYFCFEFCCQNLFKFIYLPLQKDGKMAYPLNFLRLWLFVHDMYLSNFYALGSKKFTVSSIRFWAQFIPWE